MHLTTIYHVIKIFPISWSLYLLHSLAFVKKFFSKWRKKMWQKCIKVKWIFVCDAIYTLWTYDYDYDDEVSLFSRQILFSIHFYSVCRIFIYQNCWTFFGFFKAWKQLSVKNECLNKRTNARWWSAVPKRKMRDHDFGSLELLKCFWCACLLGNKC